MIEIVENFLEKYSIKDKDVLVGFSAGPDSCALALILSELKEKFNLNIHLAYFNHGWRWEAKKEEDFTKKFALKHNFNCIIGHAPKNALKTEEEARNLRYSFFEDIARELNIDTVFLAHNKDDNVETILYRVIKGTSIKGLRSIQEKRGIYYRPLLNIEKSDILMFLKLKKQKYRVDSSNADIKYKRNFIRKKIIPLVKIVNPNYINAISNLSKLSADAQKIVDDKISEIEKSIISDDIIKKPLFVELDENYRLEILNNYLGDKLKYRDYKTLKKLDDFILSNITSTTSLNKDEFLKVKKDKIFIESVN